MPFAIDRPCTVASVQAESQGRTGLEYLLSDASVFGEQEGGRLTPDGSVVPDDLHASM